MGLFNSEKKEEESDTSVKIAKIILPVLVYIPITIFLVIVGCFFGIKIYRKIVEGGGISKFIETHLRKIFGIKDLISKFIIKTVNKFWPDKDTIMTENKTYKHVRLDSALVFTGSFFILTMIIIYNYDHVKSLMFSKVNEGIRKAKNRIQKGKIIIKNNGALISVGKLGKSIGKIKKTYKENSGYPSLWYLNQSVFNSNGVNNNYKKVKSDDIIQPDVQYYYLYDVEVDGKVIKKFNHLQLKGNFLDENTNKNIPELFGSGTYTDKTSTVKNNEEVYISTNKNVYDHNIYNVYDTNTSVDFYARTMHFIDKETSDPEVNIDNWEAHLNIPKKSGVLLKKWGRKGYKKGVYSLATNGEHTGFTLGIKGNGVDTDDPLNNYIFKDVNGKTYQVELANYGVDQFGPNNYFTGFTLVYKVRINKQNKYDVTIFINDQFVMKVEDGGVPLNEIKWCGDVKGRNKMKFNSEKDEKSKVGQYFVKNDIRCDLRNGEIKEIINDEAHCVPRYCNDNEYYDSFSRNCKLCPNDKIIKKDSPTGDQRAYPLLENCEYTDEQLESLVTFGIMEIDLYRTVNDPNKDILTQHYPIVHKKLKKLGDKIELKIEEDSQNTNLLYDLCEKKLEFKHGGKLTVDTTQSPAEVKVQAYDSAGNLQGDVIVIGEYKNYREDTMDPNETIKKLVVDSSKDGKLSYAAVEVQISSIEEHFVELKDFANSVVAPNTQSIEMLQKRFAQIGNNTANIDKNGEFSRMLDGMEEIKQELIEQGGYPISGDSEYKPKPSYMPTLRVYQTEITDKSKGKRRRAFVKPMQKEEKSIYDKFFNSFAPFTWFRVKKNVSSKIPDTSTRGFSTRNSTMIGSIAFLFGFVIFTSLLVNQFNNEIKNAKPEQLKDVFINKTSYYTYSIIFIGIALMLFAALLFYAATSDAGSKFLSTLLIVLSAVIILAALSVILKDKIDKFIKNNPYIKFFYHALFVIPCLFIDIVNYIYYEFKSSPKIVFIVFAVEIAIILSLILLPALRNKLYLYISNEKGKKQAINLQINNLNMQKTKLEAAIKRIKQFKPFRDPLVRMDLNTVNDVVTKKIQKNKDTGVYEDEITPQNTDVVGIVKKFIVDKKDEMKNLAKNINPLGEPPTISAGLNNSAWEIIKKGQLDKKFNAMKLNKLLNKYGYKSNDECDNIMNKKKADKCKESLAIMLEHIQMNAKNILLFNTVIGEIDENVERLNKIKKNSKGPLQKGTVALNKPLYFRTQKYIPIENFNKTQVEELKYNYSVSCWFFVHSQSPNFNSNYNRETSIISYNGEPTIYYHGKHNELVIRSKKLLKNASNDSNARESLAIVKAKELELEKIIEDIKKEKTEDELNKLPGVEIKIDTDKILSLEKRKRIIEEQIMSVKSNLEDSKNEMTIIYKKTKFQLQKWHNLVVNYVGGVVDIFLNGKLVASVNRIVSYKLFNRLILGDKNATGANGIGGGICNVVYYPNYISRSKIKSNYNYFKDKNPPTI